MNVAMVGLGRLGLPVSVAFASRGHTVYGYDIDTAKLERYRRGESGLYEPGLDDLLKEYIKDGGLKLCDDLADAVLGQEIVFVAVPTPSLPDDSFDTSHIRTALAEIAEIIKDQSGSPTTIALISTVLPGTCRELVSILEEKVQDFNFCYNAQFIAMGSVIQDSLKPEFVLIGERSAGEGDVLARFYWELLDTDGDGIRCQRMSLENAEIVKCAYNNFISFKIVYANTLMEICEKTPFADCDVVSDTLALATDRLLSPKYLHGGLGDGGSCHPRDNRALSYLANQLMLSADPFIFVSDARQKQTEWVALRVRRVKTDHPHHGIRIMGAAFKPGTDLTDDSPSLLLAQCIYEDTGYYPSIYDPHTHKHGEELGGFQAPKIYIIGTPWPEFKDYRYIKRSVIVDPWGLLDKAPEGCELISIGRQR